MSLPRAPPEPVARLPYANGVHYTNGIAPQPNGKPYQPPPAHGEAATSAVRPPASSSTPNTGSESQERGAGALASAQSTAAQQRAVTQKINNKLCLLFTVGLLLLAGGLCLTILAYMRLSNSVLYILGPTIIVFGTVIFAGSIMVCISQACSTPLQSAPQSAPPTVGSTSQSRLSLTASALSLPSHSNSQRTNGKPAVNHQNHQHQPQPIHPFYYNQYMPSESARQQQLQQLQYSNELQQRNNEMQQRSNEMQQLQRNNEIQQFQYTIKQQQQQQQQPSQLQYHPPTQNFKTYYLPQPHYPGHVSQSQQPMGYPDLVMAASTVARQQQQDFKNNPQVTQPVGGPYYTGGTPVDGPYFPTDVPGGVPASGMGSRSSTLDSRRHSGSKRHRQVTKDSRRRHSQNYATDGSGQGVATEPGGQRSNGRLTPARMVDHSSAGTSPTGQGSCSQPEPTIQTTTSKVDDPGWVNSDLAGPQESSVAPPDDPSLAQSPLQDADPLSLHDSGVTTVEGDCPPSPSPSRPCEDGSAQGMVHSDLDPSPDLDIHPGLSTDMNLEELLDVANSKFSVATFMDEIVVKVKGETGQGMSENGDVTCDVSSEKGITSIMNTQVTTTV